MDCWNGCVGESGEAIKVGLESDGAAPSLETKVEDVFAQPQEHHVPPPVASEAVKLKVEEPFSSKLKSGTKPSLNRAPSNFSTGSDTGSAKGGGGGSGPAVAGGNEKGGVAKRWSLLLGSTASSIAQAAGYELKDTERMIAFGPKSMAPEVLPEKLNKIKGGHPNRIRTTKYTLLTWLPLSLLFQFQRTANIYFLYISCLVVWSWSPKNWKSKIFPFAGVLLWTALKDLFEDRRRKRDDDTENGTKSWRLKREKVAEGEDPFEFVVWRDILVGDVVLVKEDAAFPADLILLHPAGNTEAFISTVMLDGETSLKVRQSPSICEVMSNKIEKAEGKKWTDAQLKPDGEFPSMNLKQMMVKFMDGLQRPGVVFKFPQPTPVLSDVRGTLQPVGSTDQELVCAYTEDNFLPRGCVLKNTPFCLGVCMYVGDETKTRLNASTSRQKFSNMQTNLNNCVRGLLIVLFACCLIATIISFASQGALAVYLSEVPEPARNFAIRFFMFNVTFYHVVPMSLYVIYEMLKLVLAFQVNSDRAMYDPVRDMCATARTAEVMEEMGQVNFLFSDKTGTLTANEMVFARCHCAGQDLGEFRPNKDTQAPGDGMAKTRKLLASQDTSDPLYQDLLNLFTCLAVCHAVQVTQKEGPDAKPTDLLYSGMSPDEVALVEAAYQTGISFAGRRKTVGSSSEVVLKGPGASERRFTVLHELAFNSDRKRMSVVVKHKGSIWCITKGADSVMEKLLRTPFDKECASDLNIFSKQGLRTLIVGMRNVAEEEYEAWNRDFVAARNIIDDTKEAEMARVGALLETGLKFVGVTAVEDRLQDGVPEAIQIIKEAGIRLWVLTGDKTETAVDIARSCRLFVDNTVMAYAIQANDAREAEDKLLKAHALLDGKGDTGLVLDGQTLIHALQSKECRKIIYDLGVISRSCICSRLSPMQKLELVQLVRAQNKMAITLAIGDGANDVPMIQGAHVGVAIRGKEGTQSVQASDVAICYFRFVVPLLLCHGRKSYRRVAFFLNFYMYKNLVLIMTDIIWMFQDKFRARIAFPEYLSVGFNVLYVAWHVMFVIGFDADIKDSVAVTKPLLYGVGPARQLFNLRTFTCWMLTGCVQGAICWVIPFVMIGTTQYQRLAPSQFWVCSTCVFTAINVVCWIKLSIYSESPFKMSTLLSTAGAILCYLIAVACLGYTPIGNSFQPTMNKVPGDAWGKGKNIGAMVIAVAVAMVPDFLYLALAYFVWPSELSKAKRQRAPVTK